MSFSVTRTGGGAAVVVKLRRGERVKAEPDALVTMSEHMQLGAALDAGLLAGLLRAIFGGESLFVQTVTASDDGDATFCAEEVGDIELIDLHAGGSVLVQKGAFLASHDTVELHSTTQLSARKALGSGAGLFVLEASGRGTLAVNAMGGILRYELRPGETRAVDNGHLVAWDAAMPYEVRMAAQRTGWAASVASSAVSGEGLMCFFQGPGRLWLQTHKPRLEPGAKGGAGRNQASGGAVVVVILMLFFFGIIALGIVFFNDRGGWAEAPGDSHRHAEAMQRHRAAHISYGHGHGHGEL